MARSYKRPFGGNTTASSDKAWKSQANRRLRRHNNIRVTQDQEPFLLREVSNVYNSEKDGKGSQTGPKATRK